MNSFDEMLSMTHEKQERIREFIGKTSILSLEESFKEVIKSQAFRKETDAKIRSLELRQDGYGYSHDLTVLYMNEYLIKAYECSTLMMFASKLS